MERMGTYSSDKHDISQIMATQDEIKQLKADLATKDKRMAELKANCKKCRENLEKQLKEQLKNLQKRSAHW